MIEKSKLTAEYWADKISDKTRVEVIEDKINLLEFVIKREDAEYFYKIANGNSLSQLSILSTIYSLLLERYIADYNQIIVAYYSPDSEPSKTQPFFYECYRPDFQIDLKSYLQSTAKEIHKAFGYRDYQVGTLKLDAYSNYALSYNGTFDVLNACNIILLDCKTSYDEIRVAAYYKDAVVPGYMIEQMMSTFQMMLKNFDGIVNLKLADINYTSDSDRQQILEGFNATTTDFPQEKTVIDLFEEQVVRTPDNVAVIYKDKKLTYRELNEKANQLGNWLKEKHHVRPNDLVGIKIGRSERMMISIFGILKAGAAYVPIDPTYPDERIQYIENDICSKVILDEIQLANFDKEKDNYGHSNSSGITSPTALAYVIYTSGTTGKPKGVMIEHRSLVNRILWMQKIYPLSAADTLIQKTTYSFDVSVWELMWWSFFGAKIFIPDSGAEKHPDTIIQKIYDHNITVIHFVPSMLSVFLTYLSERRELLHLLKSLQQVFVSGEALSNYQRNLFFEILPSVKLMNLYGPTEATIDVSFYDCAQTHNVSGVPIGKPIDNIKLFILDPELNITPVGVPGKIFISGVGVARGYLNKPELTLEKFIINPFDQATKMYDTGDIGKWLPDGNIEYLGRRDDQIKIRGHRIEAGEVEYSISQFNETIGQAIVIAKEIKSEKVLVAYFTAKQLINLEELKQFVRSILPDYMTPAFFVQVDKIPLTSNGKVDRNALPAVIETELIKESYIAPRSVLEQHLVRIWQDVLGIKVVGINDNFFEFGGHSLMIVQVTNRIYKQLSLEVSFRDFFANPTIAQLVEKMKASKFSPISNTIEQNSYPVTPAQNRMWILSQLEAGSKAYHISSSVKLTGALNIEKFEQAFGYLIGRHEILRTVFKDDSDGRLYQFVMPDGHFKFKIETQKLKNINERDLAIRDELNRFFNQPFNLSDGSLIRAGLLQLADNEWVFSLSLHHIICDGWSIGLLIAEVVDIYNMLLQDKYPQLQQLPIQYNDYSVWLEQELQSNKFRIDERYWLGQFSSDVPVLELPKFKSRPIIKTYNGNRESNRFSKSFLDRLKKISAEHGVTLFVTLMAGVRTLLYRYTGQQDIVLGTPVAGREHPDLEGQIGLYLNTLAIRAKVESNVNFSGLLAVEMEVVLSAFEHQQYPFDELIAKLQQKSDRSRSPLFDVMVVLQNQEEVKLGSTRNDLNGITVSSYPVDRKNSQFDMSFIFDSGENHELRLTIEYNTDIYEQSLVKRIFAHFENMFDAVCNNPSMPIDQIDYLTELEKNELLLGFNDTSAPFPETATITSLFEQQVLRSQGNIAISFGGSDLTYRSLNHLSNQLGNYLREKYKVKPNDLVGIKLDRSNNIVLVILGILKSGAAYVPIDPNYPQDRVDYIENDIQSKVIIDEIELECFYAEKDKYSADNLKQVGSAKDIAYVIYTSGTTGMPKGVMIEHVSLVNRLVWMQEAYPLAANDTLIQKTTYTFDVSVWELLWWALYGAKVIIPDPGVEKDPGRLVENIRRNKVTVIHFVPSMLSVFLEYLKENRAEKDALKSLKQVFVSGEALTLLQRELFYQQLPEVSLTNLYGPTEASIDVTYYDCSSKGFATSVPIGKPIANTQIYILDNNLKLVPTGVTGKLYLAGVGLARGYLKKDLLTGEKFLDNPFSPAQKMYDTGDLGRWLPDGNIEYIGRTDHQVKIRGYRIELGEIESKLAGFSDQLKQIVAEVRDVNGEKALVAYYTAEQPLEKTEIVAYLQTVLPAYMIPAYYMQLERIEVTANGKVDRKALPDVGGEDVIRKEYVAPRTYVEQHLSSTWENVLQISNVGIFDDFFELGGNSLMISQLINRMNKDLNQSISFKDFFASPNIASIAKKMSEIDFSPIPKTSKTDSYPLTLSQQRLWILSQLSGGSQAYNMPATVKLKGKLDIGKFENAFNALIRRHEVLRTCFKLNDRTGHVAQFIVDEDQVTFSIELKDFRSVENQEKSVDDYLHLLNNQAFRLDLFPLIRASLIQIGEDEYIFFLSQHHIIGDAWSMELIVSETMTIYNALLQGRRVDLPELSIQFKDYAVWSLSEVQQKRNQRDKEYWLAYFDEEIPVLNLPSFKSRPVLQTFEGNTLSYTFSAGFFDKLKSFSRTQGVTLFVTLMAGVKALLYRYSGQDDIIVGTPITGREHPDLETQIGLYLNTLAIRTKFTEGESFLELLKSERDNLLGGYEHRHYPFDKLVDDLNLKRDMSRSALFDVMVVLHTERNISTVEPSGNLEGIEVLSHRFQRRTSQFDLSYLFIEGEELILNIEYNTAIYDSDLIEGMFNHFENLLMTAIDQPEGRISNIDMLNSFEKKKLVDEFNDINATYATEKTVIALFEEQVALNPEHVAIFFDNQEYTYQELNRQANRYAAYLNEKYAIKPDDLIGVMLQRGFDMIAVILGIMKSGAAYVPIDPAYPQDRIDYIRHDTNAKIVIDEQTLTEFSGQLKSYTSENSVTNVRPENLVYVIYTSGTTGTPKGVMMPNSAMVNLLSYHNSEIKGNERTLQLANTSFDVSFQEIFSTLLAGATLYPIGDSIKKDIHKLSDFIIDERISTVFLPTAYFKVLIENSEFLNALTKSIKNVIVAGEELKINERIFSLIQNYGFKLHNHYGPAETHVVTTYIIDKKVPYKLIPPIGRPIANTQIYILNDQFQVQPIGVLGRIYIAGANIAHGYLNKPELTRSRFIANPFVSDALMYDTGDLGRWLPDGNIEFYGRKDHQVKIRGYRVELAEIENALFAYTELIRHVVVIVGNMNSENVLVAYYVADEKLDVTAMRAHLQHKLPEFMVPSFFVALDDIPLTPNGKLDRKGLPEIKNENAVERMYAQPTSEMGIILEGIWAEVLGVKKVGLNDNFFDLGGHSLKAITALHKINLSFNVNVTLSEFFLAPTLGDQLLFIQQKDAHSEVAEIVQLAPAAYYDLSPFQLRLWLISKIENNSSYNVIGNFYLKTAFDEERFKAAILKLVVRHEALRTVFLEKDGYPKQLIISPEELNIPVTVYKLTNNSENSLHDFLDEYLNVNFDLGIFPLFKVLALPEEKGFRVCILIHHIICDGWSLENIGTDLNHIYDLAAKTEPLPVLNIQYKDFAAWVNNNLTQNKYAAQQAYWKQKLAGHVPYLKLPYDRHEMDVKGVELDKANYLELFLDDKIVAAIDGLTKADNVSFIAFFIACFKLLIHRITNVDDLIIGLPVANRGQEQVKGLVGYFVNTIMHRDQVVPDEPFQQLLTRVGATLLEGLQNQSLPFEKVIELLDVKRELNRFPFTSVFMNGLDFNDETIEFSTLTNNGDYIPANAIAKFDLEIFVKKYNNGTIVNCTYKNGLFTKETIQFWMDGLKSIILQVLNSPEVPVNELTVFGKFLKRVEYPVPNVIYKRWLPEVLAGTLVERFSHIADHFSDRPAVVQNGREITYNELDQITNGIAHGILNSINELTGNNILLVLNHGVSAICGLLGTLKSGNAYVPIDPNLPLERIYDSVENLDFHIILHSNETRDLSCKIAALFKREVELIDITLLEPMDGILPVYISSEQPAYILFTSGSTGKPKGVVQSHRNVLHFMDVFTRRLHINEFDRISLLPYYNFDSSVMDIFGALLNGAALYPYDLNATGIEPLKGWISTNQISIYHSVPTIYRRLMALLDLGDAFEHLRMIVLGGEAVFNEDLMLFKKHIGGDAILINGYGPTESTITMQMLLNKDSAVSSNKIPVGYPVERTEVILVKADGENARIYEEGEIIYKSAFLALGYYGNLELTNSKFVADNSLPGNRIYFSGDIGKLLPTGEIEFVGRRDNQIKFNGIRIELDEIDLHLKTVEQVSEAVTVLTTIDDRDAIVSYVKLKNEIAKAAIVDVLKSTLPSYMIPHAIVYLDRFPLTNTNKIDRNGLPAVGSDDLLRREYMAPSGDMEAKLVKIWQDVLSVDDIGVLDNFFEMGGHSLTAIQLLNRIQKQFDVKVTLKNMYNCPTPREMAAIIQMNSEKAFTPIPPVLLMDHYAVSNSQKRMWLGSLRKEHKHLYNLPLRYSIKGKVDLPKLKAAFQSLIQRHETLRTIFKFQKDDVYQFIVPFSDHLFDIEQVEDVKDIGQFIASETLKPFDLENEIGIRAKMVKVNSQEQILLLTLHHMVSDGWSKDILFREILNYYNNTPLRDTFLPLKTQYRDYVYWLEDRYADQLPFWNKFFAEKLSPLRLPTDYERPKLLTHEGRVLNVAIDGVDLELFRSLLEDSGFKKTDYFIGIYGLLLADLSNQNQFLIGTVASGRTHIDLEEIIGVFINYLPLKISIDKEQTIREYIIEQGNSFLDVYENQDYPFDLMVENFGGRIDNSRNPFFDTTIILHNKENVPVSSQLGSATEISEYIIGDDIMDVAALDLKVDIIFRNSDILIRFEYNKNIFTDETIKEVCKRYLHLLKSAIAIPDTSIGQLFVEIATEFKPSKGIDNDVQELIL